MEEKIESLVSEYKIIKELYAKEIEKAYGCSINHDELSISQMACQNLVINVTTEKILQITKQEMELIKNERQYQLDIIDEHYEKMLKEVKKQNERLIDTMSKLESKKESIINDIDAVGNINKINVKNTFNDSFFSIVWISLSIIATIFLTGALFFTKDTYYIKPIISCFGFCVSILIVRHGSNLDSDNWILAGIFFGILLGVYLIFG